MSENLTDSNQVYGPITNDSLSTVIFMSITYLLLLITGVFGNLITCIVIFTQKYLHTATNYYLFSLSCSDLLLLIFGLPFELVTLWTKSYQFNENICVLRGLASETSTNASILTISAFTIERYLAICHPFKAHTTQMPSRAVKIVILIWFVAGLCAYPLASQLGIVYQVKPILYHLFISFFNIIF